MKFISLMKELFQLLEKEQKKKLVYLQLLIVLMALAELVGIASIAPFMAIVSNVDAIQESAILTAVYDFSGASSRDEFLTIVGAGVLLSIACGTGLSIYTTWVLSIFASTLGVQLSDRLYKYYLNNGWDFHLQKNSSELINKISVETLRVTNLIIQPAMMLNSRLVLAFVISVAIFLYDPVIAGSGAIILLIAYVGVYKFFSGRLKRNGEIISNENQRRLGLMSEGFGGVKDIIMLERQDYFSNQFVSSGVGLSKAHGSSFALAHIPRYMMEFIAFGSVIVLIILMIGGGKGIEYFLPTLSVFALAGLKLIPAAQHVYSCMAIIRSSYASFNVLKQDLLASLQGKSEFFDSDEGSILLRNAIRLHGVGFSYPGAQKAALRGVSLNIEKGQFIGVIGGSGSGKSTLIDLILGLLVPTEGKILIDDLELSKSNVRLWRKHVGYVPQSVFLRDSSIAENVAFGVDPSKIDKPRLYDAIMAAGLDGKAFEQDELFSKRIGERGGRLSGGQRQRIGIARALYENKDVLVLDEVTSALDAVSEKKVMDTVLELRSKKTIVMVTHRLDTIKSCDVVFIIQDGRLVDRGRFEELSSRNSLFEQRIK